MEVYLSNARFRVVVAGRRWGKTSLSRTLIISKSRKPRQRIWYVAPTYRMAKQIMWKDLIEAIPRKWVVKINHSSLSIELVNGTLIELKGADDPDSLRGVGIDFLVLTNSKTLAKRHGHNVCVLPLPLQVVMPSLSAHLKHITSYIPSICRDKTRKRSKLANGSHGSSQPLHLHLFLNRKLKRLEPIWMRNHSSRNFWLPSKPCLTCLLPVWS